MQMLLWNTYSDWIVGSTPTHAMQICMFSWLVCNQEDLQRGLSLNFKPKETPSTAWPVWDPWTNREGLRHCDIQIGCRRVATLLVLHPSWIAKGHIRPNQGKGSHIPSILAFRAVMIANGVWTTQTPAQWQTWRSLLLKSQVFVENIWALPSSVRISDFQKNYHIPPRLLLHR